MKPLPLQEGCRKEPVSLARKMKVFCSLGQCFWSAFCTLYPVQLLKFSVSVMERKSIGNWDKGSEISFGFFFSDCLVVLQGNMEEMGRWCETSFYSSSAFSLSNEGVF